MFKLEDNKVVKCALGFKFFVDNIDFLKRNSPEWLLRIRSQYSQVKELKLRLTTRVSLQFNFLLLFTIVCVLPIFCGSSRWQEGIVFFISKSKKDRIQRVSGIYVIENYNTKCTQAVIIIWGIFMPPPLWMYRNSGLIVLDSASNHRAKYTKNFLAERRIDKIVISAGLFVPSKHLHYN